MPSALVSRHRFFPLLCGVSVAAFKVYIVGLLFYGGNFMWALYIVVDSLLRGIYTGEISLPFAP